MTCALWFEVELTAATEDGSVNRCCIGVDNQLSNVGCCLDKQTTRTAGKLFHNLRDDEGQTFPTIVGRRLDLLVWLLLFAAAPLLVEEMEGRKKPIRHSFTGDNDRFNGI